MSSHWLRVPPQRKYNPWGFGDLSCDYFLLFPPLVAGSNLNKKKFDIIFFFFSVSFVLNTPSFTIISLSQLDTRYFEEISGLSKWNIDFVVYKRGDKEITGVSYYAIVQSRSVTCELNLEAGEYIVFVSFFLFTSIFIYENEFCSPGMIAILYGIRWGFFFFGRIFFMIKKASLLKWCVFFLGIFRGAEWGLQRS